MARRTAVARPLMAPPRRGYAPDQRRSRQQRLLQLKKQAVGSATATKEKEKAKKMGSKSALEAAAAAVSSATAAVSAGEADTVEMANAVEVKGIMGADGRRYMLDIMRLTPRDANHVPGDMGGTGNWEACGNAAMAQVRTKTDRQTDRQTDTFMFLTNTQRKRETTNSSFNQSIIHSFSSVDHSMNLSIYAFIHPSIYLSIRQGEGSSGEDCGEQQGVVVANNSDRRPRVFAAARACPTLGEAAAGARTRRAVHGQERATDGRG